MKDLQIWFFKRFWALKFSRGFQIAIQIGKYIYSTLTFHLFIIARVYMEKPEKYRLIKTKKNFLLTNFTKNNVKEVEFTIIYAWRTSSSNYDDHFLPKNFIIDVSHGFNYASTNRLLAEVSFSLKETVTRLQNRYS